MEKCSLGKTRISKLIYLFSSTLFPGLAQENLQGFRLTLFEIKPRNRPKSSGNASIPGLVNKLPGRSNERDLGVSFAELHKSWKWLFAIFSADWLRFIWTLILEAEMKANGKFTLRFYLHFNRHIYLGTWLVSILLNFGLLHASSDRAKDGLCVS